MYIYIYICIFILFYVIMPSNLGGLCGVHLLAIHIHGTGKIVL